MNAKADIDIRLESSLSPVAVIGSGMVTPIGADTHTTFYNYLARFSQTQYKEQSRTIIDGSPRLLSPIAWGEKGLTFTERLLALANHALAQIWSPAINPEALREFLPGGLPMILNLPSPRPGFDERFLCTCFTEQQQFPLHPEYSGLLLNDHSGVLAALHQAMELLRQNVSPLCLIGGIDSLLHRETLAFLESVGVLKMESNPTGFIPAEGAGFMLLASPSFVQQYGLKAICWVNRAASAEEPCPWYTEEPNQGAGLSGVLSYLLDDTHRAPISYCDQNGEVWRAEEWSYAYLRTGVYHGHPLNLHHPADCFGDIGAASGAVLLGLAAKELATNIENHSNCLVYTAASFSNIRAACLLTQEFTT